MCAVTSTYDFLASAGILSESAAFPLFSCLMTILISRIIDEVMSTEESVRTASISVDSMEVAFTIVPHSVLPTCSLFHIVVSHFFLLQLLSLSLPCPPYISACQI
ncbi:unnamed protein product [Schistosoma rodhaini]|uniref:Uncharacterized protein n=1 Tax=Schistosoma rodhaini TaxID=6188 RepID=A0AA85FWS9_9TREM|nr:unnamed protein product [Schistosoma rodhaini]